MVHLKATGSLPALGSRECRSKQARYEAQLCNVDVRQDKAYMAEHDIFPCMNLDDSGA